MRCGTPWEVQADEVQQPSGRTPQLMSAPCAAVPHIGGPHMSKFINHFRIAQQATPLSPGLTMHVLGFMSESQIRITSESAYAQNSSTWISKNLQTNLLGTSAATPSQNHTDPAASSPDSSPPTQPTSRRRRAEPHYNTDTTRTTGWLRQPFSVAHAVRRSLGRSVRGWR